MSYPRYSFNNKDVIILDRERYKRGVKEAKCQYRLTTTQQRGKAAYITIWQGPIVPFFQKFQRGFKSPPPTVTSATRHRSILKESHIINQPDEWRCILDKTWNVATQSSKSGSWLVSISNFHMYRVGFTSTIKPLDLGSSNTVLVKLVKISSSN